MGVRARRFGGFVARLALNRFRNFFLKGFSAEYPFAAGRLPFPRLRSEQRLSQIWRALSQAVHLGTLTLLVLFFIGDLFLRLVEEHCSSENRLGKVGVMKEDHAGVLKTAGRKTR